MVKYLSLALALLFLVFVGSPVQASNLQEYKEEAARIKEEREVLKEQIQGADKQRKVELAQKENELAAYQSAYEKAVEYVEGSQETVISFGNYSAIQAKGVPAEYIPIYQAAGEKYGVEWFVLASIHKIETNFSRIPTMISPVSAIGHMQFMPATWDYYGVDGNQDGKKDPWNLIDAVYGAANYLAASGAADGRMEKAVFAYNHADWYVKEVLSVAATYKEAYTINTGTPVVDVGKRFINNSTYVFGGGRNQQEIARGIFDCSSFIHWAFAQVGQDLGPLTSVTTDTLKTQGTTIRAEEMQPGDLVFFDTYKIDGHVGIYIGDGMFIGSQTSTGVAVENMRTGYWKEKFNGRVKRL